MNIEKSPQSSSKPLFLGVLVICALGIGVWLASRNGDHPADKALDLSIDPKCLTDFSPEKIVEIPGGQLAKTVTPKKLHLVSGALRDYYTCRAFASGTPDECSKADSQMHSSSTTDDKFSSCEKRYFEGVLVSSAFMDPERYKDICLEFMGKQLNLPAKKVADFCAKEIAPESPMGTPEQNCSRLSEIGFKMPPEECAKAFIWAEGQPKKCSVLSGSEEKYCSHLAQFVAANMAKSPGLAAGTPYAPLVLGKDFRQCESLGQEATRVYCRALVGIDDSSR